VPPESLTVERDSAGHPRRSELTVTPNPDPNDDRQRVNEIASQLGRIVAGLVVACRATDPEAVRSGASGLLAEIEPLQREGRESGRPQLFGIPTNQEEERPGSDWLNQQRIPCWST